MFYVGKGSNQEGVKKRMTIQRLYFGPNTIKVVGIVLIAVFSLFYLSQSSQSAARNYNISDLQQEEKDLNADKERLEVEANRLKALSIIQEKADQKQMEQVNK